MHKILALVVGCAAMCQAMTSSAADCVPVNASNLVAPGKLVFGSTLLTPPQNFLDGDKPTGFAVEIGEAIAGEMCLKPEVANMSFTGLFAALNAHKVDFTITGTAITPEREQSFDFVPYFVGGVRLIARKEAHLNFNSHDELCGLSVATMTGSVEARALEQSNRETCPEGKKITLLTYPNFNEAVQQLRKGSAQVAFLDWPFANYLQQTVPELALASPIVSGTVGKPRNRHGIVFRKGDVAMQQAVSAALARVQASGKYDRILTKWNVSEGDIRHLK